MTEPNPAAAATIPSSPRLLSRAARKRAWCEAPVRVWTILALGVAVVTLYLAGTLVMGGLQQRRLIESGEKVTATIVQLNGTNVPRTRASRRENPLAVVRFTPASGATQRIEMSLSPGEPNEVHVGETIQLRVDPSDLEHPTDRSEARPWLSELAVPLMLAPLVALTGLITLMKRRSVLNVWRDGQEHPAVVVETKQSAIAPRSKVVRFALRDGEDRRVFNLLYPLSRGTMQKGDEFWVVCPQDNPARAIAADLYV